MIILEDDERLTDEELVDEEALPELTFEDTEEPVDEPTTEVDDIPEKYKGKDLAAVVRMHQEAEKQIGKQSSEVGELRGVVDSYIKTQLKQNEPVLEEETFDFFDDPEKAVSRAIDNHPRMKEAQQAQDDYRKQTAMAKVQQKHPDMHDIVQDTNFAEWINASKIRTKLYTDADQGFDADAADELFSNWKERQGIVAQTVELEKGQRKDAIKRASTGSTRGTGETSRKVYRRSDLIHLMKTDPDKYEANAEEIMKAYAEKRVR
jgi:hypothetical protein